MVISEGMRGQVDGKGGDDDEFQALRKEVLSLRKSRKQQSETESSLIQELQRRCNRIIELEVSQSPGWLLEFSRCATHGGRRGCGLVLPLPAWEFHAGRRIFGVGGVFYSAQADLYVCGTSTLWYSLLYVEVSRGTVSSSERKPQRSAATAVPGAHVQHWRDMYLPSMPTTSVHTNEPPRIVVVPLAWTQCDARPPLLYLSRRAYSSNVYQEWLRKAFATLQLRDLESCTDHFWNGRVLRYYRLFYSGYILKYRYEQPIVTLHFRVK